MIAKIHKYLLRQMVLTIQMIASACFRYSAPRVN